MKIAVTGSSGFIGSHITKKLIIKGHEVVELVRPSLDEVKTLASRLDNVDVMCHCAWMGHPRDESDIQRNIYTSMIVGKAADLAGIEHMVFMSSGGGMGSKTSYSNSKREVESLYSKEFGLFNFDLTVLRPTAVYGEGQDPSKGLGAVITFYNSIKENKPIHILGSPYSGRDFLYVGDLADCVLGVIEHQAFGTFDVGGPELIRLIDLVSMIETSLGKKAIVQIENPTGVDPQIVELDNSVLTEVTGWHPAVKIEDWLEQERQNG